MDPEQRLDIIKGLASAVRVSILKLLDTEGPKNVNEIAAAQDLLQSTVSPNLQVLQDVGLILTKSQKARNGSQKVCESAFSEILVAFRAVSPKKHDDAVEVSMPIGLFTRCAVTAPCGLCSTNGVIGLLDVPDTFLEPDRMKAGLLWFTRGYVEYQFPNNAELINRKLNSVELSSEVPGTSADEPSECELSAAGTTVLGDRSTVSVAMSGLEVGSYELGIRTEAVRVSDGQTGIAATANVVEHLGDRTLIYAALEDGSAITAEDGGRSTVAPGDALQLVFDTSQRHIFDGAGRITPTDDPIPRCVTRGSSGSRSPQATRSTRGG